MKTETKNIFNLQVMENVQRIWRYMDLAKFISLLSKEALYFSCPISFDDPFEGFIPKSLAIEAAIKYELVLKDFELKRQQIADFQKYNSNSETQFLEPYDDALNGLNNSLMEILNKNVSKHGVSCWHKSEHESEAMWKMYSASGQGIAIESTNEQLKNSIIGEYSLRIESVHYLSDDSQEKHDPLVYKRKSFEHEKELRAIVLLKEDGKGRLVKCKLEKLINRIYVSPFSDHYFKDVIQYICSGNQGRGIDKPIIRSALFDTPDYSVKALLSSSN